VHLYDIASNTLIYSRGYDTYYGEYKTTAPAKEGIKKTFHETILTPLPRAPILLVIQSRDRKNIYHPLFSLRIDPQDYHILRETPGKQGVVVEGIISGSPHNKVDLAILGEGYTRAEQQKFEKDFQRYVQAFFGWAPYRDLKDRFNIRGLFVPSEESGVDEPRQHIYKNTLLDATFNSLDSDRYLLTENTREMRDLASQVPYDAILIMVNSKRYGGGGIYNMFTLFTSDGSWNEYVFHHEFGHAFGGLADEYYTSDVSYDQFFPPGVEPTEPNITALLNPAALKWKDLVAPGLTIPTPWGQAEYDSLGALRDSLVREQSALRAELRKKGASTEEIKQAQSKLSEQIGALNARLKKFVSEHPLKGKVGAFEGGGYVPKGFYRPTINSLMNQFSEDEKTFYPVNDRAIRRVIEYYTE
jgi:hypothetical protein